MGNKTRVHTVTETGEREVKRFIGLKFVTDERISATGTIMPLP
jgi:hypothetical protein